MLPLIVGSLEDKSRDDQPAEATGDGPADATGETRPDPEIADAEIVEDPAPEEERKAAN